MLGKSPFVPAMIAGAFAEAIVMGLNACFGSVGPCGFGNPFSILVALWHVPGMVFRTPFWSLAEAGHRRDIWTAVAMAIEFVVAALTFAGVFYSPIKKWKYCRG